MVFPIAIAAALCLGVGYVLQQRAAMRAPLGEVLHWRLLVDLLRRPAWLRGIALMVVGQLLAAWALAVADVALVEPLLSTNLLFAFAASAWFARSRVRWQELGGAALMSASLGGFIVAGDPRASASGMASRPLVLLGLLITAAAVVCCVWVGRGRAVHAEAAFLAAGAGILLGLQDVATRQVLVRGSWTHAFSTPWTVVLLISGVVSLLLSQSAFRVARLSWSLPPLVAAEPIVGIALGVSLVGDQVNMGRLDLLYQGMCLVGMIAGVVLVARSEVITSLVQRPD